MKEATHCKYCGQCLGSLHLYQQPVARLRHFREEHKLEYGEIKEAYTKYMDLARLYKATDFHIM